MKLTMNGPSVTACTALLILKEQSINQMINQIIFITSILNIPTTNAAL